MKIDRIFQIFVVKEKKFFPLFIDQIENVCNAADILVTQFKDSNDDNQSEYYKAIKILESKGDHITATIYDELNKTFVTPFDREDIHILASRIDTFLDFIHDCSRKKVMYHPKSTYEEDNTIVDLIKEDAMVLADIVRKLDHLVQNAKYITKQCQRIKEIEHKVDDLYESFISNLFHNETDAIELVKHKNIVQALEDTTDRAKDVSDTIRSLIVKSA
jgi:hypothetical protein